MASGTCVFGWPNLVDDAATTFSGGSWLAGLPLTNLKDPKLAKVARSTDATTGSTTFDVDLGSARAIRIIALLHTLQANAQIRVRASNVAGSFGTPLYDSTTLDVWPVQWPAGVLPTGHPNASTRKLTNAQIAAFRWPWVHLAATAVTARYWRFEITDTGNTDGYVDLKRLVMSPGYQPSGQFDYGTTQTDEDLSEIETSLGGAELADTRSVRRSASLEFPDLPLAEAQGVMRFMQRDLGITGQVFFVHDEGDAEYLQQRAFLARFEALSPLEHAYWNAAKTTLKLREVL